MAKKYVFAGEKAPHSGIIRCVKCQNEAIIKKNNRVPPCQQCFHDTWEYKRITYE